MWRLWAFAASGSGGGAVRPTTRAALRISAKPLAVFFDASFEGMARPFRQRRGYARWSDHVSREATKRFKAFGSGEAAAPRAPLSALLAAVALQPVDIGFDFRWQSP